MRPINNLIPCIGTDFHEVFDYVTKATPICLYTYETCNANYNRDGLYVEDRDERDDNKSNYKYGLIKQAVSETYGHNRMDNKITLAYSVPYDISEDGDLMEVNVYVTYWDGRISISSTVFFFREITGYNAYRVVMPQPKGVEGYWYTDTNGNRSHTWDFEQSIGE